MGRWENEVEPSISCSWRGELTKKIRQSIIRYGKFYHQYSVLFWQYGQGQDQRISVKLDQMADVQTVDVFQHRLETEGVLGSTFFHTKNEFVFYVEAENAVERTNQIRNAMGNAGAMTNRLGRFELVDKKDFDEELSKALRALSQGGEAIFLSKKHRKYIMQCYHGGK